MTHGRDAVDLNRRLSFIGLDDPTKQALKALKPLITQNISGALAIFYDRVTAVPETARFFSDRQHIDKAKSRQADHWRTIAAAEYGDDYGARVLAIGETHARLGLEPRWYIGGYALVLEQLINAVVREHSSSWLSRSGKSDGLATSLSAIVKAAMLDMDLAISTYLDALDQRRKVAEQTREKDQNSQRIALAALSSSLERLSKGDLTVRLDQVLATEFDSLKEHFNSSVERLETVLKSVSTAVSSINTGLQEISAASDDLSRRTEQQAANLEQTVAALEETSVSVRKSSEGATHTRSVVNAAREGAEKSDIVVRSAVDAMIAIESSSKQIGRIIGVIDDIAFQTNLLALNAGVEAARAGEAGRGFAVVASEVRALAQRSATAAKEIKTVISTSAKQVTNGVTLVTSTGESLSAIIKQVSEISGIIGDMAAGAKEQATALQELNTAANQMDQITQQNAAMAEQATAAVHSLRLEADRLSDLMAQFVLGKPETKRISASRAQNFAA